MADFLLEIGTEEIPAQMVRPLCEELAKRIREGLEAANLRCESLLWSGAPRRIGFLAKGLPSRQEDRVETVVGPAMAVARDEQGSWTKAALGFARKQGADLALLKEVPGAKGPSVGFEREVKGHTTAEILAEVVPAAVDALYLPKAMRWGEGGQLFVRPVRWVVALLDAEVVPMVIKGTASGRTSRGHRIHGSAEVTVPDARSYFDVLRGGHVVADPEERRNKVEAELAARAAGLDGRVVPDPELLEKMVFLCEFPTVLSGEIPDEFLSLPTEVLVTCLREHQSFFVVRDAEGRAMPHFLSVMDGPADPRGFIRQGLENVSRSRLSDAQFFFEHDKAVALDRRLEELKGIVFHPKLGTYYDKALRMEALALKLAAIFGANAERVAWAAKHCKCDLASLLVQEKEFTSLQGMAGGLYAAAQGQPQEVAEAIYDHYRPLSTEDDLPRGAVGVCVALADKLDTLMEMFRIGQAPTGSKDPFALRRAGTGVMRILVEHPDTKPFDLIELLKSLGPVPGGLSEFLEGRLRFLWEQGRLSTVLPEPASGLDRAAHEYSQRALKDARFESFPYDEISAVLAFGLHSPWVMTRKLSDLHLVRKQFPEDFDHLAVAFKRVKNILTGLPEYPLSPDLFMPDTEKEGSGERTLFGAYEAVKNEAELCFDRGLYHAGLRELAKVRPAVDRFFDDVLVMCDPEGKDPEKTALQQNRLALLQRLVALFNRVADFSEIVPKEG